MHRVGFCDKCGHRFVAGDEESAYNTWLHHGFGYMHQWCFDLSFPIFITRKEAEIKWAEKIKENPKLLD